MHYKVQNIILLYLTVKSISKMNKSVTFATIDNFFTSEADIFTVDV